MSKILVFVSFDLDHDHDLYERLLEQSKMPSSIFEVSGCSEAPTATALSTDRVQRRIREANHVIAICGEHSKASKTMSAEIEIAHEEQTPYLLLWGRRELMCTKPKAATSAEGMYSWTQMLVHDRLELASRKANTAKASKALRDAARKGLPEWTR